jgi:hypothetical protein
MRDLIHRGMPSHVLKECSPEMRYEESLAEHEHIDMREANKQRM